MRVTVKEPATLLAFLQSKMEGASNTKLRSLLKHRSVLVDGVPQVMAATPLAAGQVVEIRSASERAVDNARTAAPFKVLFEDECILLVDKPRGWLSIAREDETRETLYQAVFEYVQAATNKRQRCFIVHRLDREVSGVMLFAKTEEAKKRLMNTWDENVKIYAALVEGVPTMKEGTIEGYLKESNPARVHVVNRPDDGARHAVTHYRVLDSSATHSLLEVRIETGRRHQIRAHMASMGHPIAGDKRYGSKTNPLARMALHAWRITFNHPVSNKRITVESPLPPVFRRGDKPVKAKPKPKNNG